MSHANGSNGSNGKSHHGGLVPDGSLAPGVVAIGTLGDRRVVLRPSAVPAARATTVEDLEREVEALPIVEAQHADDQEVEAAAAQARADAEADVADAQRIYDEARTACAARRDDNALADARQRARGRVDDAQDALADARKKHEEAKARSAVSAAAVEEKRRAATIIEKRRALDVKKLLAQVEQPLENLVHSIIAAGQAVVAVRQVVASAADEARYIREMGGPAIDVDETFAAGVVARVLAELGGGIGGGVNVHEYRWPFAPKWTHPTRDRDGRVGALELLELVFRTLDQGRDAACRGKLREVAEVWSQCLDRQTAEREIEARQRPAVDARVAASVREQQAHRAKQDANRFAGFALRGDGSPVGSCHVCGKAVGTDAIVDRPEQGPQTLRHPACFGPPSEWEGEYQVEQLAPSAPPAPPRPRGHWDEDGSYSVDGDHTKPPTVG